MFNWFKQWWNRHKHDGYSDNSEWLAQEKVRIEAEVKANLKDEVEIEQDSGNQICAKVSYFTIADDASGTVYLDVATMEHSERAVRDLAKIIAGTFNIKVQAQTIGVIRENLIKSDRPDLLDVFMKAIIVATADNGVSSFNKSAKEQPCVRPTDFMK